MCGIEYKGIMVRGPAGCHVDTLAPRRLAFGAMNNPRRNPTRAGLATGIAILMLTLSVAVPVLERGTFVDRPVVEQEHAPGDCPSGHDHTVCTQVGANLPIDADVVDAPVDASVAAITSPGGARLLPARTFPGTQRSRAPPLA